MKKFMFILLTVAGVATAEAQDKVEATVGADIVNEYIWRGQDLGNVSLQPTLSVAWKGLSLSTWGSVGLANAADDKELDLTLAYSIGGFNIGVTDYWFSKGSYFQYKDDKTTHTFEANIGYDFGFLSVQWFTNFAGVVGVNEEGKRAYSSYFELSAPFSLGGLEWKATLGATPYANDTYKANGFCVTDVSLRATKDIALKSAHLPVFVGLTANPRAEKMYLVCGLSFAL